MPSDGGMGNRNPITNINAKHNVMALIIQYTDICYTVWALI